MSAGFHVTKLANRASFGFTGDLTTGLGSNAAGQLQIYSVGTELAEWGNSQSSRPSQWIKLAIVGAAGSTGVFASLANPFGYNVIIVNTHLVIATQSTGASTVDIGIGADATTSNDGLIDGLSGATAGDFSGAVNGGTNGKNGKSWSTTTFLNVAEASGDVDALAATLWVEVIRA